MPPGSQVADQAKSIRPAAKHIKAMRLREELDATGRIKSLEAVRAELAERQAEVDVEMAGLLEQVSSSDESPAKDHALSQEHLFGTKDETSTPVNRKLLSPRLCWIPTIGTLDNALTTATRRDLDVN